MNAVYVLGTILTLFTGAPVLLQLRGQPRGLFVLFFAEMWERFSYYGMRGLLIFFLTQHLLFPDREANAQYGSYTSLVYLMPLLGGALADRYLGTRRAVLLGGALMAAGSLLLTMQGPAAHRVLTVGPQTYAVANAAAGGRAESVDIGGRRYALAESSAGLRLQPLQRGAPPMELAKGGYQLKVSRDGAGLAIIYLALSLLIMGVGFLKSNITTMVGQLYSARDPRRDSGFTLYYYGINIGAFWAAAICGWIGLNVGWWAGFGLAGLGMITGLIVFILGKPLLGGVGEAPDSEALLRPRLGPLNLEWLIYLLALGGVGVIWATVQHNALIGYLLSAVAVLTLGWIGLYMVRNCDRVARDKLLLIVALTLGAVVFFTLFEQAGSSLNLFAARNTDLDMLPHAQVLGLGGYRLVLGSAAQLAATGLDPTTVWWIDTAMTAAQTQAINAGFILLLAPVFAALWNALGRVGLDPHPVLKFAMGLVLIGLGYLVLVWCSGGHDQAWRVPLALLTALYFLHTLGEFCLSPVGLAQITRLSPVAIGSTMMAVWYLALALAQYLAARVAAQASGAGPAGAPVDPRASFEASLHVFHIIGWVGVGAGVCFALASPLLRRLAHGEAEPEAEAAAEASVPLQPVEAHR